MVAVVGVPRVCRKVQPVAYPEWRDRSAVTSNADRQRAYRERKGSNVGGPPGPKPSAPCGTVSAYKRHLRHLETPCTECRAAWAEYHRNRK